MTSVMKLKKAKLKKIAKISSLISNFASSDILRSPQKFGPVLLKKGFDITK